MAADTLGVVSDKISDMLVRGDLKSGGQIGDEVRSAVRFYQSERFWFNESRISLSCSSTITEYTLSATTSVVQILQVQIMRNSSTYVIEPISEEERLSYDTNNITGDPNWYSIYAGLFIPYPRPTTSPYTATIAVIREPGTLSASGNTNVFLENASELITSRAAATICLRYTHDTERSQTFKLLEREAYQELQKRTSRLTPSRIVPTKF